MEENCFSKEDIRVLFSLRYLPIDKVVPHLDAYLIGVIPNVDELVRCGLVQRIETGVQKGEGFGYKISLQGMKYADQAILKPWLEKYKYRLYFDARVRDKKE